MMIAISDIKQARKCPIKRKKKDTVMMQMMLETPVQHSDREQAVIKAFFEVISDIIPIFLLNKETFHGAYC